MHDMHHGEARIIENHISKEQITKKRITEKPITADCVPFDYSKASQILDARPSSSCTASDLSLLAVKLAMQSPPTFAQGESLTLTSPVEVYCATQGACCANRGIRLVDPLNISVALKY